MIKITILKNIRYKAEVSKDVWVELFISKSALSILMNCVAGRKSEITWSWEANLVTGMNAPVIVAVRMLFNWITGLPLLKINVKEAAIKPIPIIEKRYMNMNGIMEKMLIVSDLSKPKNKVANIKYKENFINDRKKGKKTAEIIAAKKIFISDTSTSIIPEVW